MTKTSALKKVKDEPIADRDASSILRSDHKKVTGLFDKFQKMEEGGSRQEKGSLVKTIYSELLIHTAVEEEIFDPAVRKEIRDDNLMNEAKVEHAGAKDLIHQLEEMQPDDEIFDAKVKVLNEYVRHYVKEEQKEMFPKVRKTNLDLDALESKITKSKKRLIIEKRSTGD